MSSTVSNFKRECEISLETLQQERDASSDDGEPHGFSQVAVGFLSYDGELREPVVLGQEVMGGFVLLVLHNSESL